MEILDNVKDFINSSKELPSLPEVIIELNAMMAKSDLNINILSKLIETDIALSTSILSMANSPLYRGLNDIKSVKDGIMRIGIKETKNLIYSSSVMPLFKNIKEINPNNFWKHSIFTAYTAEILGEMINYKKDLSILYTCALLHDMGVLVMAQFFPEELNKILRNTIDESGNINQGFFDVFNTMHSEVGGMLLKRWELPDTIVQCALYHHYPDQAEKEYQKEVKVIKLANEVTILEGYNFFNTLNHDSYPFSVQYDSKKIIEIRDKVKEKLSEIDAMSSLLG